MPVLAVLKHVTVCVQRETPWKKQSPGSARWKVRTEIRCQRTVPCERVSAQGMVSFVLAAQRELMSNSRHNKLDPDEEKQQSASEPR